MPNLSRAVRRLPIAAAGILLFGAVAPQASGQAPAGSGDSALFRDLRYRLVGPSRGGRVTTVTGVASRPGTFYMGASGGGVWKTEDYGQSWANVSDGFFGTSSIGAVQVADSDPDVVYAGTGSEAIRSNVITGRGIYRSTDAGASWRFMGLREAGQIGAVEVHPADANRVYVAALGHPFGKNPERGVFRSKDGGATWENVLFVADSIGAVDLELNPADPREIYAALWRAERKPWTIISGAHARSGVGIYKSTDGGDSWRRVSKGLPEGLLGKIDFAVSPADPARVYALVEAPGEEQGLYRSDDRGESWRLVNRDRGLMTRPFYFTNVTADPTDADVVYVGNVYWYRSADGGRSFERRPTPHVDNHDLWIHPEDPRVMVQGNDGGANVSQDGGRSWSTQLNQPTAELYQVHTDDRFPYWVYAGQQDNSTTIGVPSLPPSAFPPDHPAAWWATPGGCETGPAVPKPGDWATVFTNCKGRFGRFSYRTGQEKQLYVGAQYIYGHNPKELVYRFQRVAPIAVSPHDPEVVYFGSQYLHRTRDGGRTWETISPDLTAFRPQHQVISGTPINRDITGEEFFSTLYAIAESPRRAGVIWTGSNDGLVQLTRDGGATWTNVTPRALPADARIQNIEASPHDPAEAYLAAYRYLLDDWQPYIFRTTDYGKSWTRLTTGRNGIPADHPTRVVREDPDRPGLLYAGTEFGLFVSFDEGARWQPFQLNLPVTPVTDIRVFRKDLVLSTMGRSFWILDDLSPLHQATPEVLRSPAHLFAPDEAYRMRYWTRREAPTDPEYPPVSAVIDYWLGEVPAAELRLEILDASGTPIRAFSSQAPGTATSGDPAPLDAGAARLPRERGLNRFRWDLSHPGPWDASPRRSGRDGPMVLPGSYRVRLSAGEWSQTRPLEVRLDPRVAADGVTREDLEAQLTLTLEVRDLLTRARRAAARLEGADAGRTGAPVDRTALDRLRERLITAENVSYPQPMLVDQIEYLYGMLTQADQRPGEDAYERYRTLRTELERHLAELDRLLPPGGR